MTSAVHQAEYRRLLEKGISLLARREHSRQELHGKLSSVADVADVVSAVVEELQRRDLLSDERFTESYVRSRCARGFGPLKIAIELSAKGISETISERYLQADAAVWQQRAKQQYQKKYASAPLRDYADWARRARFLQSRGFTSEHISAALPSIAE